MTRRRRALAAIWLGPSLVFVAITAHVMMRARLIAPPRLAAGARGELLAIARGALDGRAPPPARDPAVTAPVDDGTVVLSLWSRGTRRARATGQGASLAAATTAAARALVAMPAVRALAPAERAAARLQVDVVVARAGLGDGGPWLDAITVPAVSAELVAALAIVPGQDGVGARFDDGHEVLLVPGEVVDDNLVERAHPVGFVPDIPIGFEPELARRILTRGQRGEVAAWFRFRTDAFVESPAHDQALALDRGLPPGPAPTRANLRAGALAGARATSSRTSRRPGATSTPTISSPARARTRRPAATACRATPASPTSSRRPTASPARPGCARRSSARSARSSSWSPPAAAPARGPAARTRASATPASAARRSARRRSRSSRWSSTSAPPAIRATATSRSGSGAGCTRCSAPTARSPTTTRSRPGPATRSRCCRTSRARRRWRWRGSTLVTKDPADAAAAARALDWLVDWYDFFLGGFFFGEEHWTCIAAEALDPALARPAHREFCAAYGAFLRAQQRVPAPVDEGGDLVGAYSAAPFLVPNNTPTGSRTEAMISTWELTARAGEADPALAGQIRASLAFLLRQQIAPDRDFAAAGVDVLGAVPGSLVDREVRIDYVQHVGSAMVRAAEHRDLVEPTQE